MVVVGFLLLVARRKKPKNVFGSLQRVPSDAHCEFALFVCLLEKLLCCCICTSRVWIVCCTCIFVRARLCFYFRISGCNFGWGSRPPRESRPDLHAESNKQTQTDKGTTITQKKKRSDTSLSPFVSWPSQILRTSVGSAQHNPVDKQDGICCDTHLYERSTLHRRQCKNW